MICILRTLLAVGELKLYSACTRFGSEQESIKEGFARTDYTLKLTLMHTVTKEKFKITPRNIYNIVRNLETAVNWFYDENMKDMFFMDNGILCFNYDYGKMYAMATSPEGEHIEIRPTVDYGKSERGRESVVIFLNNTDSQVIMERADLEAFYTILKEFSFQSEALLLLYELDRAIEKYISDGGKLDERANEQGQGFYYYI